MTTTYRRDCRREGPPAAGVPPRTGGVRARPGLPPVRRERPQLSRSHLRRRRRGARARAPAPRARRSRPRRSELLHTSNLFFHPLQGELAARLVDALGAAARVLLQQRRRSGRGVPEVRAPVLARGGRAGRTEFVALQHSFHGRTMGALSVTWDDHYRAPFAPLIPGVTFVAADDAGGARGRGHRSHGRGDRRADPGRRRRAADHAGNGRRDRRRVPPHRRAAHRRRSAVRPRPHRTGVLLRRPRPASRT